MTGGKETGVQRRSLKYGMVGGGLGSFIGDVHRKAIALDGKAQLVSGCFSRNYDNTLQTGEQLGLFPERLYRSYSEMAADEGSRPDKIDFVVIVTPNDLHYSAAKAFLEQGIHVVCDKPLTFTVDEAEELAQLVESKQRLFCVTYTYSGYPMVKHAREMVQRGEIGEIRVVMGEYPQDWLATSKEKQDNKQASWRTNPKHAGCSNCLGDIGSHIENTVSYMTGLTIQSVCANLDIFGEDRTLDDNAEVLVKYTNGASGVYWSSQLAIGHDNGLKIRIFGTKGSIEWEQENPNYLRVALLGQPVQILSRGSGYIHPRAAQLSRIPSGHPEGYYEAFANIYSTFADAVAKTKAGIVLAEADRDYPTIQAGVEGVRFITRCVESSSKGAVWVSLDSKKN